MAKTAAATVAARHARVRQLFNQYYTEAREKGGKFNDINLAGIYAQIASEVFLTSDRVRHIIKGNESKATPKPRK